jgi:hypothetical protein
MLCVRDSHQVAKYRYRIQTRPGVLQHFAIAHVEGDALLNSLASSSASRSASAIG